MLLGCYAIYNKSRLYPIIYHQQHYYLIPASNDISKLQIFIMYILGPQSAPEDFGK
jgi:hypothetical protein